MAMRRDSRSTSCSSVISVTSALPSSAVGIAQCDRGDGRLSRCSGDRRTSLLRKHAQAGAPAVWVRVWRAPISYQGQFVFVARRGDRWAVEPAGGRRRVRLHPDVDEVRNFLIHDFMYSGGLEKLALVSGVGAVAADQPRKLAETATVTSRTVDGSPSSSARAP